QIAGSENTDQPEEEAEADTESVEVDPPADNDQIAVEPTEYVKVGEFDTMIEVTAEEDIYITFVADGNVVFDGDLSNGDSTGAFPGSEFEVYTSSGGATLFTNGCGEEFYFGDDMSEANYEFGAGPTSCAVDPAQLRG
ncbi:MAG: hypothetical protein WKF81_06235, partial [Thermomicrobiales bacterium]